MRNQLFFWALVLLAMPAARAQRAPWGLTHLHAGPQAAWSYQNQEWQAQGAEQHFRSSVLGLGGNGRLQTSVLDLLLYGKENKPIHKTRFRIADVLGVEGGLGYLHDRQDQSDVRGTTGVSTRSTLWFKFGYDLGAMASYRVLDQLDVGIKYANFNCNNAAFASRNSYGQGWYGGNSWGGLVRYGRVHVEVSYLAGASEYYTAKRPVTTFDLKYRYGHPAASAAWAPYVGLQLGIGNTPNAEGTGVTGGFSRNWVQVSLGKMSNY